MSAHLVAYLYCDAPADDCPLDGGAFETDVLDGTIAGVRRRARSIGWVRRGGRDLCSDCKAKPADAAAKEGSR